MCEQSILPAKWQNKALQLLPKYPSSNSWLNKFDFIIIRLKKNIPYWKSVFDNFRMFSWFVPSINMRKLFLSINQYVNHFIVCLFKVQFKPQWSMEKVNYTGPRIGKLYFSQNHWKWLISKWNIYIFLIARSTFHSFTSTTSTSSNTTRKMWKNLLFSYSNHVTSIKKHKNHYSVKITANYRYGRNATEIFFCE